MTDEKKQSMIQSNKQWILVFRQTYSRKSVHNTAWKRDLLQLNEDDPSAPNYAILHKLETFRSAIDNKFEFKLFWPDNLDKKFQHWKQTTNPTDQSSTANVIGYEPIQINHKKFEWGGLEWTKSHSVNGNTCLMNGCPSSDFYYWYALGVYDKGYEGGIPGPDGTVVSKVELWVKADLIPGNSVDVLTQQINELKNKIVIIEKEKDELQANNIKMNEDCKELQLSLEDMTAKYNKLCRKCNIDESDFMKWNSDDVTNWIVSLDEQYETFEDVLRAKLKEEDVDGTVLGELDKSDLHRFGIISMKHKLAIMKHITRLKNQNVEGKNAVSTAEI